MIIFLLPPGCALAEVSRHMERNEYNRHQEIEPAAGMRRFKLWREDDDAQDHPPEAE